MAKKSRREERAENKLRYEKIWWELQQNPRALLKDLLKRYSASENSYHKWKRTHDPDRNGTPNHPKNTAPRMAAFDPGVPRQGSSEGRFIMCSPETLQGIIAEAVSSAVSEALTQAIRSGRVKTVEL